MVSVSPDVNDILYTYFLTNINSTNSVAITQTIYQNNSIASVGANTFIVPQNTLKVLIFS